MKSGHEERLARCSRELDCFLGRRTLLAAIYDQASIRRILQHLGLPTETPTAAPAWPTPDLRLPESAGYCGGRKSFASSRIMLRLSNSPRPRL